MTKQVLFARCLKSLIKKEKKHIIYVCQLFYVSNTICITYFKNENKPILNFEITKLFGKSYIIS